MKIEIKRDVPAPVPAPVVAESRAAYMNQNTCNNVAAETTRTVKAVPPQSPSSAEYSSQESESEPSPPIKPRKKEKKVWYIIIFFENGLIYTVCLYFVLIIFQFNDQYNNHYIIINQNEIGYCHFVEST